MWNQSNIPRWKLDFFARNTVAGGRLTCHGKDCESTERGKGCRIENILF